jgi:hypothetical protein
LPVPTHLVLNSVRRCLVFIPNSHDIELPSLKLRWPCPIDVGIEVNFLLLKLDNAIMACKPMPAEELCPSRGLDGEAKSCIQCKAGNNEEHHVVVRLQTEAMGEVKAMVIAPIECNPEGLSVGDES